MATMEFETVAPKGTTSFGMVNCQDQEIVVSRITLDNGQQQYVTLFPPVTDHDLLGIVTAAGRFLRRALNVVQTK